MICKGCGNEFDPTRSWSLYCNSKCRMDYHNKKRANMGNSFSELKEEDRKTVKNFLEAAEKDPTLWADLLKQMEYEDDDEVPVP